MATVQKSFIEVGFRREELESVLAERKSYAVADLNKAIKNCQKFWERIEEALND